ncbi:MAG: Abi family protein [Bacillota bacterium]
MGEKYVGKIVDVYKNYGIIKSTIENHEVTVHFLILPDMMTDGVFRMTENITYQMKNIEIRKSKVYVAYNLENIIDLEIKSWELAKHKFEKTIINDHYTYLFKKMAGDDHDISQDILNTLINYDKKAKEFFIRWILYIESQIKDTLIYILKKLQISSTTIYRVLNDKGSTKSIVDRQFKFVKSEFMFKPEFSTLSLKKSEKDPNDIVVSDCPIPLFLESISLNELGEVLNQILEKLDLSNKKTFEKYKYLYLIKESFLELAFIRNSSAHGNPLIPIVLDNNFNANYLYDMASAFPSWNSKESVERWELFNFIRFTTRSLYKQGIPLVDAGSPQLSALAFTKSLLINPAKRSFFMFFYVMLSTFEYIDSSIEEDFWEESSFFVHSISGEETKNYFDVFPNKKYSVKVRLTRLVLPLISYRNFGHVGMFKPILESSMNIPQKKYLVEM